MKVFILIRDMYEDGDANLGVYASQPAAEEAMYKEEPEEEGIFEYRIEEHELEGGLTQ